MFKSGSGISPTNAARIAALYDELWNVEPPAETKFDRISAGRARAVARRRGYLPPLALDDDTLDDLAARPAGVKGVVSGPPIGNLKKNCADAGERPRTPVFAGELLDEIAIEEAIAGRPVRLTRAEATEAQHRMRAMGYTAQQIAERLHITERTVQRRWAA